MSKISVRDDRSPVANKWGYRVGLANLLLMWMGSTTTTGESALLLPPPPFIKKAAGIKRLCVSKQLKGNFMKTGE